MNGNENMMQDSLNKYLQKRGNDPERAERYIRYYKLAEKNGVISFRCARIAEDYTDDYYADTGIPQSEKEWYYERGIPTFKVDWYGLTKENYNDYISDFDFYNAVNYLKKPQLIRWYDYKLTTYYVLDPFRAYMPRHYFFIENGTLIPIDADVQRYCKAKDVLPLIQERPIALKACRGGHGEGFYKVAFEQGGYTINNSGADEQAVIDLISRLDDYILTDYCVPHKVFRDACGDRFTVMRTVTVFDRDEGPQITAVMIRMGSSNAGLVSDYDGSIYCGVDLNTGRLFHPLFRTGDAEGIIRGKLIENHPDTGVRIEALVVPRFDELCSVAKKISAHLAMTPYLVMDIIPTDDGFRILEIDSHGMLRNLETFYPFRKNRFNLRAFITRDW